MTDKNTCKTIDLKTGENLKIDFIMEVLQKMSAITGASSLEEALVTINFISMSNDDKESFELINRIYKAEMNGDLIPDPSIKKLYLEVC